MRDYTKTKSASIGLGGLVFIIFLILKLGGIGRVATWSWWWVTSPLLVVILAIIAIVIGLVSNKYINK